MLKNSIIILLLLPIMILAQKKQERIHQKAILIDTHNDIITAVIEKKLSMDSDLKGKTQSDLTRFKKGGVDVQFFSVWSDGMKAKPYEWANEEIDTLYAVAARNPDKIKIVANSKELRQTVKAKKIAALFGLEGGHMIENSLDKLEKLYNRGVRYMTLTWNNSTAWSTSAQDETTKKDSLAKTRKGLSDLGKQIVQKMNALGMIIDLSHVGEQTFWDAINLSTKPVIASHSNAYTLCPVPRNLKDDQIKAIGKNGGVINLNFYSGFVDSSFRKKEAQFMLNQIGEIDSLRRTGMQQEYAKSIIADKYAADLLVIRPPMSALLDHLDYIVKLIGVNHIGIGSDFDGITSSPKELNDVTDYSLLTKALFERGYTKKQVYKILGGNMLRILKANETN